MASRQGSAEGQRLREVARELYRLPREEFVAARNQRARELRQEGDAETAARVRSLRKPTVVAWALDQAAQQHPDHVEELMETIASMQSSGGSSSRLRELAGRHDELVDRLAREADAAIGGDRAADLAAAVRAGALSEDAQRFVDGWLADTPSAGEDTLAAALAAGSVPARRSDAASRDRAAERAAHARQLRAERADARRRRRQAAGELRAVEREVSRAERELEDARRRLERCQAAERKAATRLEQLDSDLDELDE